MPNVALLLARTFNAPLNIHSIFHPEKMSTATFTANRHHQRLNSLMQGFHPSSTTVATIAFVLAAHITLITIINFGKNNHSFPSKPKALYVSLFEESQSVVNELMQRVPTPTQHLEEKPQPLKIASNKQPVKPQEKMKVENKKNKPTPQQTSALVQQEEIAPLVSNEQHNQASQTTSGDELNTLNNLTNGTEASEKIYTNQNNRGGRRIEGTGNHYKTVQISQLRFRHAVKPEYPPYSRQSNETGQVEVRAKIDTSGNVINTTINHSSGYEGLDNAALAAAEQSSFYPYIEEGIARQTMALIPYHFNLSAPTRRGRW